MPRRSPYSRYLKIMDRETWTHALASAAVVVEMNGDICARASIVLGGVAPIPWRAPEAESLLAGQRVTPELARRAGEAAVQGARPLGKNAYKVPLTQRVVERAVRSLVGLG
jgi:xanthine dehydrogenase YagS FAD-binding subunit